MIHLLHSAGLILALTLPASVAPTAARAGQGAEQGVDALADLHSWMERFRIRSSWFDPDFSGQLDRLLSDVRKLYAEDGPEGREGRDVILALLDVGGIVPNGSKHDLEHGRYHPDSTTAGVRRAGSAALEALVGGQQGRWVLSWLASEVLIQPRVHPLERRLAAVELMAGRYQVDTQLALFTCASASERAMREAAIASLAGWEDENVDRFMAGQVIGIVEDPGRISTDALRAHFDKRPLSPDSSAGRELAQTLNRTTLSEDWRLALRAVQTLGALNDELAVQPLIEGLSVWMQRRERGQGSRRLEGAIVAELQRRSGRNIGPHPDRWARWWQVVQAGQIPAGSRAPSGQSTQASFFGLRPETDKVVFVIDRSGSMDADFGQRGHTRYEEALSQMVQLLESLGPETRFSVTLFANGHGRWSTKLRPATSGNLGSALNWAKRKGPSGGTNLQPAIRSTLELDRKGVPNLDRLEADTIIVLCDGATEEGSSWVAPLMRRIGPEACVVFHCAQIGPGGDGTLEGLAEQTGGEFTRVQP